MARARIEDVAHAASVSIKTVSRVLNREANVRPETRERVMQAVKALRYTPDASARSLAGNRSFNIALLYNNPSDNYMMGVISGVLEACAQEQYHLLLCPAALDEAGLLEEVDELVARSRPDGLLLTPPLAFLKCLILRREFVNGIDGVLISYMYAFQRFIRLAKTRERFQLERRKQAGK